MALDELIAGGRQYIPVAFCGQRIIPKIIDPAASNASNVLVFIQFSVEAHLLAADLELSDYTAPRKELQVPVYGSETHMGQLGTHALVDLVGRRMRVEHPELFEDDPSLFRHSYVWVSDHKTHFSNSNYYYY